MIKNFRQNQEGAIAVLVGIMLPVLVGLLALALDLGHVILVKTQMQNAVDAAACGGAIQLQSSQALATSKANALIISNNFNLTPTVTFTQDAHNPSWNPGNAPECNVTLTNAVPTYFMKVLGIPTVNLTAYAEAILIGSSASGPFNYALFSNTNLVLSGNRNIQGSAHANTSFTISGSDNIITGAAEGYKGFTASGSSNTIGSIAVGSGESIITSGSGNSYGPETYTATDISMPNYMPQIEAIATEVSGNKTYSGSTTLNGDIYVTGNVTISGTLNGTGCILAGGNITISGATTISGSNQVFLYAGGSSGITLSGANYINTSSGSSAILYAPNGGVTASGNLTMNGSIIANSITISGTLSVNDNGFPVTTLPGNARSQLID
ncbi:MAG: pilus assembly protein TadG-related protein [Desulfobaccales bacterium]